MEVQRGRSTGTPQIARLVETLSHHLPKPVFAIPHNRNHSPGLIRAVKNRAMGIVVEPKASIRARYDEAAPG